MAIRGYVQQHGAGSAVVTGAGMLGLEAAHSLHELGLRVTVLERGERLLAKQVDARCSEFVHAHFEALGIEIRYSSAAACLPPGDRASAVRLKDGTSLPCDVFLAAVGIRPNIELAAVAGLAVNRGVLVDDRMQASVPGVFAAGDVAEHNGMLLGLWPIAAKQAEVAAVNAIGGDERLIAEVPATILKGVGLDVAAVGRTEAWSRRSGNRHRGPRKVPEARPHRRPRLRRRSSWPPPAGPGRGHYRGQAAASSRRRRPLRGASGRLVGADEASRARLSRRQADAPA